MSLRGAQRRSNLKRSLDKSLQSAKRHEVTFGNRGDLVFEIATLAFGRLAMTEKREILEKLNY